MTDLQRETLGNIARLAEQMSYAAMQGHTATVQAQFDTMKKYIAKIQVIQEYVKEAK